MKAEDILERTTVFDGERYEVGLLWNDNEQMLPDNIASATLQNI